ncbi:MAG TPA: hypothetical protein VEA69_09840 [Tepidisphaeraceae bacterium]|nr:hypothetical protein [Tepidisphaeraceae bacterium]
MFDRRFTIASMAALVAMSVMMGARGTVAVAAEAAAADSPAAVMTAFFTAVEKGDYPAATALLSAKGKEKTTEERLKQLNQTLKGGFTVGEAELQGDTAKVKCSVPKKRKATSFYLVKEGGKWLYQGN